MSKISTNELAEYAVEQLASGADSQLVARRLAAYLLQERRSRDMPAIMRAIEEEMARRGSPQIVITSAHAISEETKKQLSALLDVKNPVFSEVIDPSVIGGVKARSGESEIDLTVSAKLNRFKAKVMESK